MGFARDCRLSAVWRTMAMFAGALPPRNRAGAITKILHPVLKANPQQVRIDGPEHVTHHVVAGDTGLIRKKAAEEGLMLLPHSVTSTKSSAPAIVAAIARRRISTSGYNTLAHWRGSLNAAKRV